jgi:hypothetical protein
VIGCIVPKEVMDFLTDVLEAANALQQQEAVEAARSFGFATGREPGGRNREWEFANIATMASVTL